MAAVTVAAVGTAASVYSSTKARNAQKKANKAQAKLDQAQLEAEKRRLRIELGLAEGQLGAAEEIRALELDSFAQEKATARLGLVQAEQQIRLQAIQAVRESAITQANIAVAGAEAGTQGSSIVQGARATAQQALQSNIALLSQAAQFQRQTFNRQQAVADFGQKIKGIDFQQQQAARAGEIQNIQDQLRFNTITGALSSQIRGFQSQAQQNTALANDFSSLASFALSSGL